MLRERRAVLFHNQYGLANRTVQKPLLQYHQLQVETRCGSIRWHRLFRNAKNIPPPRRLMTPPVAAV